MRPNALIALILAVCNGSSPNSKQAIMRYGIQGSHFSVRTSVTKFLLHPAIPKSSGHIIKLEVIIARLVIAFNLTVSS